MKKTQKANHPKNLSISQNFITNPGLLNRIVNKSTITKEDAILEIGTGKGHLTQVLCDRCALLYSVELDPRLYEQAKNKLSHLTNLRLIQGDFLKMPIPAKGQYKVFANIPFSITSRIIAKLTSAPNPPSDMWLVMEKGAAKRFLGLPRETKKSLLLKVNWDLKIVYYFKRNDFHPAPSADTVLLQLSRKAQPDLNRSELAAFQKFIEHSLRYGISGSKSLLTKKQASTALRLANLPPIAASGEILYIQWLCLFRCHEKFSVQQNPSLKKGNENA